MTTTLQPSLFNLRVPLPERNEVFLMNTITDAQLVVSPDVAELLDRFGAGDAAGTDALPEEEQDAIGLLKDNGFLVPDRQQERRELERYFARVKSDTGELHVTILATLQCNFACDY